MPNYGQGELEQVLQPADVAITASGNQVIDLGPYSSYVVWFASGTNTTLPCNAAGTALPGAAAANLTSGIVNARTSRYVKITAGAAGCTVCRI